MGTTGEPRQTRFEAIVCADKEPKEGKVYNGAYRAFIKEIGSKRKNINEETKAENWKNQNRSKDMNSNGFGKIHGQAEIVSI